MRESDTICGVFIIESLKNDDEDRNLFEGKIISNILHLNNIPSKYYYVRTKRELYHVVELFKISRFRYLHISCHGKNKKLHLSLDELSYKELAVILGKTLYKKRLFLSACASVNWEIAKEVIPLTNCYSIIGPISTIEFRDAAIIWTSFYHLMFKMNSKKMVREGLIENLQKVANAFQHPLNYFSISKLKGVKRKKISIQKTKTTTTEEQHIQ